MLSRGQLKFPGGKIHSGSCQAHLRTKVVLSPWQGAISSWTFLPLELALYCTASFLFSYHPYPVFSSPSAYNLVFWENRNRQGNARTVWCLSHCQICQPLCVGTHLLCSPSCIMYEPSLLLRTNLFWPRKDLYSLVTPLPSPLPICWIIPSNIRYSVVFILNEKTTITAYWTPCPLFSFTRKFLLKVCVLTFCFLIFHSFLNPMTSPYPRAIHRSTFSGQSSVLVHLAS